MKKRKKWAGPLIAVLILAGCLSGAAVWYQKQNPESAYVYRISDGLVGLTNFREMLPESYGKVTSDHVQSVYLSNTQTVDQIYVYEGQQVRKGEPLFSYDTTLTALQIQRKDLAVQQMKINLTTAQDELKTIRNFTPIYYRPTQPTTQPQPSQPERLNLDVEGLDYLPYAGLGYSERSPLKCWLHESTQLTDALMDSLFAESGIGQNTLFVVFQNTENNSGSGKVVHQVGVEITREKIVVPPTEPPETEPEVPPAVSSEPTVPPTVPPETTEPPTEPAASEPPTTTDPAAPEPPASEPAGADSRPEELPAEPEETTVPPETDFGEPDIPESGETTEGGSPAQTGGDASVIADHAGEYKYLLRFFRLPDTNRPAPLPKPPKSEVSWNSGYTASEIAAMRQEKETEIKDLTFQIRVEEAELRIMRREAGDGVVRAEIDGVVRKIYQEPDPDSRLLMKLTDGGSFQVDGTIGELYLDSISVGQKVTVRSWDDGTSYLGEVTDIGIYPVDDPNAAEDSDYASYRFRVEVDESANLSSESTVSILAGANPEETSGLYLSNAFLRTDDGISYVMVKNDMDLLEKRQVRTGKNLWNTYVQILDGLTGEDCVAFPYGKEAVEGAPTQEGDWDSLNGM